MTCSSRPLLCHRQRAPQQELNSLLVRPPITCLGDSSSRRSGGGLTQAVLLLGTLRTPQASLRCCGCGHVLQLLGCCCRCCPIAVSTPTAATAASRALLLLPTHKLSACHGCGCERQLLLLRWRQMLLWWWQYCTASVAAAGLLLAQCRSAAACMLLLCRCICCAAVAAGTLCCNARVLVRLLFLSLTPQAVNAAQTFALRACSTK